MKKIFLSIAILALTAAVCACGLAAQETSKPQATLGQELFRFGTEGTGPSQMKDVNHVAVDPQGFIYTGDWELGRVQRFSPRGELESLSYLGLAPGERIWDLAFDGNGFLYVKVERRLLRYDPATWALVGEVKLPYDGGFKIIAPRRGEGIAAMAESTGDVVLIDKDGTIARTFPAPLKAAGVEYISSPYLAVDGQGFFYIADNYSHSVYRFDPEGRFLNRFGSEGEGPGQIDTNADGLAIDSLGQVWVSDWGGASVFAPDGRFLERFEDMGGTGLAISDQDELYAAADDEVIKYAVGQRPQPGKPEKKTAPSGDPDETRPGPVKPVGLVSVDPKGFVYVGEPETGRVLRYAPWGDLDGFFVLQKPRSPWTGLAVDRDGILYIAAADRLFRYDRAGKLLGEIRHPDGDGFFHVAPRPDAGVLASWRNPQRDDLVLIGKDGTLETIHRNAMSARVGEPAGDVLVAMDGRRNLYAASRRLHTVCLFRLDGEYLNRLGSEGGEPGQLSGSITGLAVDGHDQILVHDAQRISIFSAQDGRFLKWLNLPGTGLAISDDDEVITFDGTKVTRLQAAKPVER